MTCAELRGRDVIGRPGQQLTAEELGTLVQLADGVPAALIAERLGLDRYALRDLEASIQAKLGATNKAHMITRGFTLGVLIPNALCLLLAIGAALAIDQTALRPRTQHGPRSPETARLLRSAPAGRCVPQLLARLA